MCGLGCLVGIGGKQAIAEQIAAFDRALAHRGPDDRGFLGWDGAGAPILTREPRELGDCAVMLAHRRLSIIDVGPDGWQPMLTAKGSHAIIFNGEIYNYLELRAELEAQGCQFRTHSDTEVLLQGWVRWGAAILPRLVGMFAFIVLDRAARKLAIARDPFGIKPLYWTRTANCFAMASEIGALLTLEGISRKVDPQSVYDYLRLGFTDRGASTLYADIHRLPAAHWAEIDLDAPSVAPQRYWSIDLNRRSDFSPADAVARLRDLFVESVRLHLRSDVPVGAALSGGIDSTAVVAAMRRIQGGSLDIHAFSYVAEDQALNEEPWIDQAVAATDATVHKVHLSPPQLIESLDKIVAAQGEPFGSTSILAQFFVYQKAHSAGIKVTMDGQGADEMLAGYPVYVAARFASLLKKGHIAGALSLVGRTNASGLAPWRRVLPRAGRWLLPASLQPLGRRLIGENLVPPWIVADWFLARGAATSERVPRMGRDVLRGALLDSFAERSLPALLRYGDRNSMIHSVESRVPFLSPALVEFIFSLDESLLLDANGTTKSVFRAAMRGIVPDAILDRRDKIGFATPQNRWLAAMAPWAERVLAGEAAHSIPAVNPRAIAAQWEATRRSEAALPDAAWRWLNLIRWTELAGASFT